jgi:hypothetical protein
VTTCIVGGLAGRPRARSCHHEGDPPTHRRDPFSRPRLWHRRAPGEPVVEPGQLPGELHAPPRNDRSASSLAGRPCLIIGVRECRHGTGNIVRRASVEATLVVGDRARVRRFRRIRTVHISGRTSPDSGRTSGSLRASRIASPHWGQISAASGSFRTSMKLRGLDHD